MQEHIELVQYGIQKSRASMTEAERSETVTDDEAATRLV